MIETEKQIGKRMRIIIRKLGYRNVTQFAEKTGIRRSTVYAIIKNNSTPQLENMELLEKAGINTDWLLTGKGEMFLDDQGLAQYDQSPPGKGAAVHDIKTGVGNMQKYARMRQRGESVNNKEIFDAIVMVLQYLSNDFLYALKVLLNQELQKRDESSGID